MVFSVVLCGPEGTVHPPSRVLTSQGIVFVEDTEKKLGGPLGLYMADERIIPSVFRAHEAADRCFTILDVIYYTDIIYAARCNQWCV